MNEELLKALGVNVESAKEKAFTQGLLGSIFQAAALSGPQPRPISTAQALGQVGMAGMGGYESAFDKTLKEAVTGLQVKDLLAKQAEEQRLRKAREAFESRIAGATQTLPTPQSFTAQQSNIEPQMLETMSVQDVAKQAVSAGLPTQQVISPDIADRAVMDYLRQVSPIEYAKLMAKQPSAAIQEYAFAQTPQGGGFKGTFQQFLQSKTPSTNVSLSTEKTYGGTLAGEIAKSDAAKLEVAQAAPKVIETAQATRNLLEQGNVFTGYGATQRLDFARAADLFGISGKDTKEKIANTQQLFQNRAQATLDSIRSSGLGSGQGFSNKDREFLENAKLGNITYSKEALLRQLDLEERVAKASIDVWNKRFENIPQEARSAIGIGKVELPKTSAPSPGIGKAPAGVRQEVWNIMTPEQKALWR